jgi:hypothetical protein
MGAVQELPVCNRVEADVQWDLGRAPGVPTHAVAGFSRLGVDRVHFVC